ncbi:F-box protein [Trifolium medium]|uniref:F-box protein n=1 Tax=Trifolium medium TaxID=97028 RepID=A0A392M4B2_9FABA|nr:F-box protein [Trifolium medium]
MSIMKTNMDFIQWLGHDLSMKVFSFLDDSRDLIRVSAVCSSWGDFVIENDLCKKLCLKIVPEVSGVVFSIEVENVIKPDNDMLERYYTDWEFLKRNHKVYARLAFGLTPMRNNCVSKHICVACPNNDMEEGIVNILEPRDKTEVGPSYWPSKGKSDPSVTETELYKLCSKICLVTEIHVQPFKG